MSERLFRKRVAIDASEKGSAKGFLAVRTGQFVPWGEVAEVVVDNDIKTMFNLSLKSRAQPWVCSQIITPMAVSTTTS